MSAKLKPLLLPQLVEERRQEEQRQKDIQHFQQLSDDEQSTTHTFDSYVYSTHSSSSSSDLASLSPVTPSFSRTSHTRYSGSTSTSSLEIIPPTYAETPSSPTQTAHASKNTKPQLPDVQEDPLERDEESTAIIPEINGYEFGLYDCLCDEPCHHHGDLVQSAAKQLYMISDLDFDLLSDTDLNGSPRLKKRRHGSDAGFSSWGTRLGSKLTSLPRWGSTSRRHHFAFSPASDPSLDQRPHFSRAPSSRSSSISVPARGVYDRTNEPPMPATPALSFYESTESVVLPSPLDTTQVTAGQSLERERAMATTPLLPPLMTDNAPRTVHSSQPSPLQSPAIAPSLNQESTGPQVYPTPPLSAKASVSSFRRATVSSTTSDAPSPITCLLDHHDAWSDRLGHANFTIEPRPYSPETADMPTLHAFHADWDQARINYTRHLVRTGEHYGTTSKTYALTEAKWAETEQEWYQAEHDLLSRLNSQGNADAPLTFQRRTTEEMLPAAIPRMLSDEGKFPERGDVDIVGPMVRDPVMMRDGQDEKKKATTAWLKSFVEKVAFRK
ncbi:hypothetical protein B0T19DRAFT_290095 [Cercophora scortea]|uniref:Only prolin and serin are matching in the corresponding protein n=1 Tax=Cercophora scortea TaxID=314031 RepID=A0AAE0M320_9PEZI|nr:hypothetical protein B0T19DRAFT_290095 [Cercophora scortea]